MSAVSRVQVSHLGDFAPRSRFREKLKEHELTDTVNGLSANEAMRVVSSLLTLSQIPVGAQRTVIKIEYE